jgi:hypothetical protein
MIKSVPYILAELPMNLLVKRLGAHVTLPIMVILWGIVSACQGSYCPCCHPRRSHPSLGAVHSYHSLLVCRFFLGAIEGIIR